MNSGVPSRFRHRCLPNEHREDDSYCTICEHLLLEGLALPKDKCPVQCFSDYHKERAELKEFSSSSALCLCGHPRDYHASFGHTSCWWCDQCTMFQYREVAIGSV